MFIGKTSGQQEAISKILGESKILGGFLTAWVVKTPAFFEGQLYT